MNHNNWQLKMKPISKTFLKGLMAIIPITLTLYLLFWLAGTAELALGNIFKFFFPDSWYITGLGFVLGLAVVFFVGSFLESQTFRRRFDNVEQLVIKIPVVKTIYTAIRDFTSLFSSEQKGKFKQVVLVNIPPGNRQQIGFITVSLQFRILGSAHILLSRITRLPYFCHSVIRWVETRSLCHGRM